MRRLGRRLCLRQHDRRCSRSGRRGCGQIDDAALLELVVGGLHAGVRPHQVFHADAMVARYAVDGLFLLDLIGLHGLRAGFHTAESEERRQQKISQYLCHIYIVCFVFAYKITTFS